MVLKLKKISSEDHGPVDGKVAAVAESYCVPIVIVHEQEVIGVMTTMRRTIHPARLLSHRAYHGS